MSINNTYLELLKDLWYNGMETSPRGMKVKELLGNQFTLHDPTDNVITLPGFETNVEYAKEELEWYKSASNRIDFSPLIERTWKRFSDDGKTANSAYGYYIFSDPKVFGINQWDWIKKKLSEDSDSRQCIINISLPQHRVKPTKDVPCTVYIQVFIRNNRLHWITNMRSNDIFFGLRNDVYCFTELQKMLAKELNVELGVYIHFAGSLHLYEKHFEKARELIGAPAEIEADEPTTCRVCGKPIMKSEAHDAIETDTDLHVHLCDECMEED